ncbi:hypothetical protein LOTGIDRAFT_227840 [Lottia gigantea]|uniref:Iodothyronine deiodinase n=1 Tax=Lottia gigantea TaxID=225164 RepID=V4BGW7_LOTGI|nr:hypothetical protein LOTGIDRAFT_227840 [Lottia gigantea]ESP05162.1 hypothetical protein LOTGIDRAFT_227840 [Lottia gigantea]
MADMTDRLLKHGWSKRQLTIAAPVLIHSGTEISEANISKANIGWFIKTDDAIVHGPRPNSKFDPVSEGTTHLDLWLKNYHEEPRDYRVVMARLKQWWNLLKVCSEIAFYGAIMILTKFSPSIKQYMVSKAGDVMKETGFSEEDWSESMCTWAALKRMFQSRYLDVWKTAELGEAHSSDGWRFENNFEFSTHTKLNDRVLAAKSLLKAGVSSAVVLDSMKNEANNQYGGLFERLYIVLDGVIVYQGERGPNGYRIEEVEDWLQAFCTKTVPDNGTSHATVTSEKTSC